MHARGSSAVPARPCVFGLMLLTLLAVQLVHAAEDGLARTPPMGWRSWNFYACEINVGVFERQADALVDRPRPVDGKPTSLLDLGYDTVGIDGASSGLSIYLSISLSLSLHIYVYIYIERERVIQLVMCT